MCLHQSPQGKKEIDTVTQFFPSLKTASVLYGLTLWTEFEKTREFIYAVPISQPQNKRVNGTLSAQRGTYILDQNQLCLLLVLLISPFSL